MDSDMLLVRKKDVQDLRSHLQASAKLLEEIEFSQGVKEGRKQLMLGESCSLDSYKAKRAKR